MPFKDNFRWGAATASYQIEGSPVRQGGGESVWDQFCRREDVIKDGSSGFIACDHVERYREDVSLMRNCGLRAYRFSLSWPRILPSGTGAVSEQGLGFYDRLVDELLAAGIEPWATLFHWDFPLELYHRGGWLNRDSADWFAEYTGVVVKRLSDRVQHWMTLNEPQCFIGMGHRNGDHAPGLKLGWEDVLRAGHHALLAHGKAVQVIRAHSKTPSQVGYAPVGGVNVPASHSPEDIEAARSAMFSMPKASVFNNAWWFDPVLRGHYPEDGHDAFGAARPPILLGDLETICQPLDFLGANIYNGRTVRAGRNGIPEEIRHPPGIGRTVYDWPVTPEALYWGSRFFYERYNLPIVITENGVSTSDWVDLDGRVHDAARIDFLRRYLLELKRAVEDGVDVLGYFHWTLMDNFEWQEGGRQRFGLIHVDYTTQKRTPKDSAAWFEQVSRSNGESLALSAAKRDVLDPRALE
jgi:beta-glucosidase